MVGFLHPPPPPPPRDTQEVHVNSVGLNLAVCRLPSLYLQLDLWDKVGGGGEPLPKAYSLQVGFTASLRLLARELLKRMSKEQPAITAVNFQA